MVEDKQMHDEVNEILWGKKKTKGQGDGLSTPPDEDYGAEEILFGKKPKNGKETGIDKIVTPSKQAKEEMDIVTGIWMGDKKKKPAPEPAESGEPAKEPAKKKANRDDYFGL